MRPILSPALIATMGTPQPKPQHGSKIVDCCRIWSQGEVRDKPHPLINIKHIKARFNMWKGFSLKSAIPRKEREFYL